MWDENVHPRGPCPAPAAPLGLVENLVDSGGGTRTKRGQALGEAELGRLLEETK
jgi:hypothetical protein